MESRNTDASLSQDESLNVGMLWRSQMASELDLQVKQKLEMWANAQRDGRPAEYRWRPLFNTAKFG